jgi:serine/threonine protein kinase
VDETRPTAGLPAAPEPEPTPSELSPKTRDVPTDQAPAESRAFPVLPNYEILDVLGQGGMGVIYRAIDLKFGREVAVKVLLRRFRGDSGATRRFATEARITGQLQHPAIPPAHDVGTLPDGRPFLTMKLIRGRTLAELLVQRKDPLAERGRFLTVFEHVCQALAYAHTHNVLHRDLKPANIMVGAFGEVQLMDWGLAKVLPSRGNTETEPEEIRPGTGNLSLRDSDGMVTQMGSVLGSPAFMAPEQAVGAFHNVDTMSDVFGLGGILAVILTGEPPFEARSVESALVKAAKGDVDNCFARLDASGADPQLVALCKQCLSPRPAFRPLAHEVADKVAAIRAAADDRARRAEVKVEMQAPTQKRRRALLLFVRLTLRFLLAGVLAALLISVVIVVSIFHRSVTQSTSRHTEAARVTQSTSHTEAAREGKRATSVQLNNQAWSLLTGPPDRRDPVRALQLIRQALQEEPDKPSFWNTLGVALYRNGQYKEAVASLNNSVGKGQSDAYNLFFLAMCHARLGDEVKAKECFDQAVKWMEMHKDLNPERVGELKAFRAETETVLRIEPGTK